MIFLVAAPFVFLGAAILDYSTGSGQRFTNATERAGVDDAVRLVPARATTRHVASHVLTGLARMRSAISMHVPQTSIQPKKM